MREFDAVKHALMGDAHLPVDGQPTLIMVKRQILEPEGSLMPLDAGESVALEADSVPQELRAVADCLETGAEEHAKRLRVIADALEKAPQGPEGVK
jgi:hypothetical protein